MLKLQVITVGFKPDPKKWFQGSWTNGDHDFLHNKKAIKKLHQNFKKSKVDLNVRIIMSSGHRGKAADQVNPMLILPNMINFTMLNNVTNDRNWLPLTSWIIGHRLAHAMQARWSNPSFAREEFGDDYYKVARPEGALWYGLSEIYDALIGFQGSDRERFLKFKEANERPSYYFTVLSDSVPSMSSWSGFLASELLTMKSARERILSNELDVYAEVFAQYVAQGRVRFNRLSQERIEHLRAMEVWNPNLALTGWGQNFNTRMLGSRGRLHGYGSDPVDLDLVNRQIAATEVNVNNKLAELLPLLQGKHISF